MAQLSLLHLYCYAAILYFILNFDLEHIRFLPDCAMMLMLQSQAAEQISIEREFFMERTLTYTINNSISPLPVSRFLRQKGFSIQSLTQLKKDPAAVLADGTPCFMNHVLQPGEVLTIHILEEHSSEKIPPVALPLDIVYEDEDLMVINKPAEYRSILP